MPYSKKAAKERRLREVDRLKRMLEDGVQNYLTDEHYHRYLRMVAKFHDYSARNSMLIMLQNPLATAVASFMDWKHKFHRHVKAGEHGIRIIAPIVTREEEEGETGKKAIVQGFRVLSVFDVSQTEGEPLPALVRPLTAGVPDFPLIRRAAAALTDCEIREEKMAGPVLGVCRTQSRTIVIREGLPEAMAVKTLIHEIAHSRLHVVASNIPKPVREIQAESVAYIVCAHLGIDTGDYSYGYLVSWGAVDRPEFFRSAMPAVVRTASEFIEGIDLFLRRHASEEAG